ncbi:hypothetical protein HDIA_1510 [Hartmannibacter diazotrophicus]|uniref:Uncharacterized protein n=1 Tax=Hartmannibacter diazotrophicus TaxID=1482074 RepID=A0A2C9D5N1_9HYPH|nr:hypothetical protein HDIA_1510 [Hartmannibacter diazotrophicus]
MKYAIDVRAYCYDPDALRQAALNQGERSGIARDVYNRARTTARDPVAFDLKALLVMLDPMKGCELTVNCVKRFEELANDERRRDKSEIAPVNDDTTSGTC